MTTRRRLPIGMLIVMVHGIAPGAVDQSQAADIFASPPASVTMSIYDRGFALVEELRRISVTRGENTIQFGQLPVTLDSSSVSFLPLAGARGLTVLEQQFRYDLGPDAGIYRRYLGAGVAVTAAGGAQEGTLSSIQPFTLSKTDGSAVVYPRPEDIQQIHFLDARQRAFLEPTLIWRTLAEQEGPLNIRLSYLARDVQWGASYECVLDPRRQSAYLSARMIIQNRSGGAFPDARIKFITTEKGRIPPVFPDLASPVPVSPASATALRYAYLQPQPDLERVVASAGALRTYELPRPITLDLDRVVMAQLVTAEEVPIRRIFVYDGVRFDRYQRYRRNDWNYGTEFHSIVEMHVEFENRKAHGLGLDLPAGRFRLYQRDDSGAVDLLGEDYFHGAAVDATGHVLLGPARGLEGERERTGYVEVSPLHEYDESFEIRLSNQSSEDVEVRVVEHLYRWPEYEIVRADTEYKEVAPQTIEFRPVLKPGGKRSVHYTVRYRW
jgi:hypothetical protein